VLVDQCQQSWDSPSNYCSVLNQVLHGSNFVMCAWADPTWLDLLQNKYHITSWSSCRVLHRTDVLTAVWWT